MLSTLCSAFFSGFVFLTAKPALMGVGIVLWGVGMGAQESIMKAAVSRIVPAPMRSTGFGIFETGFGIAWFLGSWLLGALYDASPARLVGGLRDRPAPCHRVLRPLHPKAEDRGGCIAASPPP